MTPTVEKTIQKLSMIEAGTAKTSIADKPFKRSCLNFWWVNFYLRQA